MGELIGYARCSTVLQDLTAQREILTGLGVTADRIYLNKGLTGTNRARPGLDQALATVRAGDTLVLPKLDRLARSVPDARDISDTLVARGEGVVSAARAARIGTDLLLVVLVKDFLLEPAGWTCRRQPPLSTSTT